MSKENTDAWAEHEAWKERNKAAGQQAHAESQRRVRAKLMTPEREAAYRAGRPDVAHAIDSGQMEGSAMEHYFNSGQSEGSRYVQPVLHRGETDMTPYLHHIYHEITGTANDLGYGGRADWTGNEVFHTVDGQDVFALNDDVRAYADQIYGDLVQYANMMGFEGRADWSLDEIAPYVKGQAIQVHSDFNNYLDTLYQGIQGWANENIYGGRNDWSLDEVRQALQGQNVIEIARGIGLA